MDLKHVGGTPTQIAPPRGDRRSEAKKDDTDGVSGTIPNLSEFRWQRGYSSFSVDASKHDVLIRYIENQEAHHQLVDFKDEMRKFYALNKIAFDDQYVWD